MIEKLKNWWISIMPSIGLAPVVEESDYDKLDAVLTELGLIRGHRIVDYSIKRKTEDGNYVVDARDFEQFIVMQDLSCTTIVEFKFDSAGVFRGVKKV